MNEQMATLANIIRTAERGNPAAIKLLRSICRSSADRAPDEDLIRIAKFLYDLRDEAARQHIESN